MLVGCETNSNRGQTTMTRHSAKSGVPARYAALAERLDGLIERGENKETEIVDRGDGGMQVPLEGVRGLVIVLDTSGSNRSSKNNLIEVGILDRIQGILNSAENVERVTILDTSSNRIADWRADPLIGQDTINDLVLSVVMEKLAFYAYESVSNWSSGLWEAHRIVESEYGDLNSEIFIIGDEFLGNFWADCGWIVESEVKIPVNVMRSHENLKNVPNRYLNTPLLFERYGRYLAEITGGYYYEIVPPPLLRDWLALMLGRLALEYPGELWQIKGTGEEVERINGLLQEEMGEHREFLTLLEEGSNDLDGYSVSIEMFGKSDPENGYVKCYLRRAAPGGVEAVEYRVEMVKYGESWRFQDWQSLWKDGR